MPIVNDIFYWFLKRRTQRIKTFIEQPFETQNQVFKDLLLGGTKTVWGEKYYYSKLQNISNFQESTPISTYEELFPYIERVLKGEPNVLWQGEVNYFSKSSGTTNARSKFIPVSTESLENCHYLGGRDVMTFICENRPNTKIFDGKGLSVGGSLSPNPYRSETQMGDVSAIIMKNLPTWAEFIRTPSLEIALLDNWDDKLEKMALYCSQDNVSSILGVPTWIIVILERILEITGKDNLLEVWANFEGFVHGAVNFQPYRQLFKEKFFPSNDIFYLETYNASEGFFAIQDDLSKEGEMLLMLDYGIFYEFMPMEEWEKENPQCLILENVELDKNYALIISTNAGLWRYKIGDTIKFTSLSPHRIKITGRTKHFINAFGEELVIENADTAITYACQQTGAVMNDYTAAPIYMQAGQKGGHEWIIELSKKPTNETLFFECLDNKLREVNSDYDAKRYKNMALMPPKIHLVEQGTFYRWLEKRGKLGGQHKVPRLSNSREYVEEILEL